MKFERITMAMVPFALGMLPALVAAQVVPTEQDTVRDVPAEIWNLAARSNWYLRVAYADQDTITGRVRIIRNEPHIRSTAIPLSPIISIERQERKVGRAAFTGAALGFGAAALAIAPLASLGSDGAQIVRVMTYTGLAGGMLGFGIGYMMAPGSAHWEPIWPDMD